MIRVAEDGDFSRFFSPKGKKKKVKGDKYAGNGCHTADKKSIPLTSCLRGLFCILMRHFAG